MLLGWTTVHFAKKDVGGTAGLHMEAESAVMLDAGTGEWLFVHNGDEPLPPASMSKMMTELMVLDAVQARKMKWSDEVRISEYAAGVAGAGMGLQAGQKATVRELFEAMAIHSCNDAAVALAEKIAGTETAFVKRMNKKARDIGLSRGTRFANATGLSSGDLKGFATAAAEEDTVMTAKDVALLAEHLIRSYPEVLDTTRKPETLWRGSSTALRTTNEMLPGQRFGTKGNDGLKTGYTKRAGYCFAGTTERGGRRLITVVMGTATPEARFEETKKLLDYGWRVKA
ncbi:D-alanyl-D-alanine carboxypeptidase [Cohnella pontilimi]|uniref:D-alanyl-D-alanine carboxypeptidase n=2 Tax=Cohnella pontilimi TaxID=2564100 RepID=A0A4U0FLZ3_9BACL|nr:D-alanyl-D-alanine carboxypeptidase [Cohnella pontilimi]